MDENKFTPTAEEALQLAQEAAGELGHGYVGTEHLLLGLMREDEGSLVKERFVFISFISLTRLSTSSV